MKLSLKFRGNDDDGDHHHHNSSTQTQIMTAKVPITVFNYPLMSIITSTTTNTKKSTCSDFTFSLSTNFPTGPTLRLSYSPSLTSSLPFSLSLKSGLSLFGSPRNSPLIFSANFPLSTLSTTTTTTTTHTPPPSFFLHFKPQFGHFSLNKTVFSNDDNNNNNNALPLYLPLDNPQIDKGFVASPYESSSGWQNLNLEPYTTKESNNDGVVMTETENNPKRGLSPALAIMARTVVPVTQGLLLNFRWGVNFMGKSGFEIPYLTVNKIGLERVEEVKQKKKDIDEKGMLFRMRKELESVEKENREIKRVLNEMKNGVSNSISKSSTTTTTREGKKRSDNEKVGNKQKNSFQHWENNNGNNEKNTVKQPNQNKPPPVVVGSDLESESQKAIKEAASNSY